MKITAKDAGPAITPNPDSVKAADARARAIARLAGPSQAQPTPVQNPSAVAVEEMAAIQPQVPTPTVQAPDSSTQEEPAADKPKSASEDSLASRFAILARKEKAARIKIQQQEQTLRAKEEALKAKEAEIAAKAAEYESGYISKQRFKDSPLEAIAEAELSYEELTQQLIDSKTPQDPRLLVQIQGQAAKIAKLEKLLEDQAKSQQDQVDQNYKAALRQIETDVKTLVNTDPAFETVKATRSVKDVVDLIEQTYKKDGVLLSVEEAAQEVEDYLVEEAMKLAKLSKIQKRLTPQAASTLETKAAPQTGQPKQSQMKTLTNATSSTRQLSARERAVLAFKGELKS